jgi:hypothetical protein
MVGWTKQAAQQKNDVLFYYFFYAFLKLFLK